MVEIVAGVLSVFAKYILALVSFIYLSKQVQECSIKLSIICLLHTCCNKGKCVKPVYMKDRFFKSVCPKVRFLKSVPPVDDTFRKDWIKNCYPENLSSLLIYVLVDDYEVRMAAQAWRLRSFYPVLERLENTVVFASQLAYRGFYFRDGFVVCYLCHSRTHIDYIKGSCPQHHGQCRAALGPTGATIHAQFWEETTRMNLSPDWQRD